MSHEEESENFFQLAYSKAIGEEKKELFFWKYQLNPYYNEKETLKNTHYSQIFRILFDLNYETLTIEINDKQTTLILSHQSQESIKHLAQQYKLSFENVLNSVNKDDLQKINSFIALYAAKIIFLPQNTIKKSTYSSHDLFFLFQFELSANYSKIIIPHSGNSSVKYALKLPESIQRDLKKINPNKYIDQNMCVRIISFLLKSDRTGKINHLLKHAGYTFTMGRRELK
jgi:cell division protein ZapA (FtsZ GTPase activity inhibitor)